MGEGEFEQRVRSAQIELLANVGAVIFHRPQADAQLGGDVAGQVVLSDQFQDAAFGRSQIEDTRFVLNQRRGPAGAAYKKG